MNGDGEKGPKRPKLKEVVVVVLVENAALNMPSNQRFVVMTHALLSPDPPGDVFHRSVGQMVRVTTHIGTREARSTKRSGGSHAANSKLIETELPSINGPTCCACAELHANVTGMCMCSQWPCSAPHTGGITRD